MYITEIIKLRKIGGMKVAEEDRHLVKVTHSQSGISVTKASKKNHLEAKEMAICELEELIGEWEGY